MIEQGIENMSTNAEIIEHDPQTDLVRFTLTEAKIAELLAEYGGLTVAGPTDTAGQKTCHSARMVVRAHRVAVEKSRVEIKAVHLMRGRAADSEAKRLSTPLEALEARLEGQEQIVAREQERLAKVAEDARRAVMAERLATLRAIGSPLGIDDVSRMTEAEYADALSIATTERAERLRIEAEAKRLAAEQAEANRMEREQLAAEREAMARAQREQDAKAAAERAELDAVAAQQRAAQKAIDDAAAAVQRKDADERLRVETEARVKLETEARIKREAEQAEADRVAREAEQARDDAARPYRERVSAFADALLQLQRPDGPDFASITKIVSDAAQQVRAFAVPRKRNGQAQP